MDVFVSWSGDDSRVVASSLKFAIEEFFSEKHITVFVSETDIDAGKDWYRVIKDELNSCKLGILCLTPCNNEAPWLCFEAGAMAMTYKKQGVIPLLLGTRLPERSPLAALNYVQWNYEGFCKILNAVAKACEIKISLKKIRSTSKGCFEDISKTVEGISSKISRQVPFNKKQVYPKKIDYILQSSVFLCGPMASLADDAAYSECRKLMLNIACELEAKGLCPVYYGGRGIEKTTDFEESIKSVKDNFAQFKLSEYVMVMYPESLPSSVLVEIGYAIALSKPMVIFTKSRDNLPFLLKDIDKSISSVSVFEYKNPKEILRKIRGNGVEIFQKE